MDAEQRAELQATLLELMEQALAEVIHRAPPGRPWPCDACRERRPVVGFRVREGRLLCATCATCAPAVPSTREMATGVSRNT